MEKILIGTASPTSESEFRSLASGWDSNFREGEQGILVLQFSSYFWRIRAGGIMTGGLQPTIAELSAAKKNHASYLTSWLKAKGYKLWKDCDVSGDNINVYFTASALPVIIVIAIVAACAAAVVSFTWMMVQQITAYKLKQEELAQWDDTQDEWAQHVFDAIDELPPEEKLNALEKMYELQKEASPLNTSSILEKYAIEQSEVSKRVLFAALGVGVAMAAFAILRR